MALTACVDLNCRDASSCNFIRVNRNRGGVALNHAELNFSRQTLDGFQNETGFSSSGGGHQVNSKDVVLVQDSLVVMSQSIVGIHDPFDNFNALFHRCLFPLL